MNREDAEVFIKLAFMAGLALGMVVPYLLMLRIERQSRRQVAGQQKKCPCCMALISPSYKRCSECFVELEGR